MAAPEERWIKRLTLHVQHFVLRPNKPVVHEVGLPKHRCVIYKFSIPI